MTDNLSTPRQLDFFDGVAQFNIAAGVIEPTTQQFDAKRVGFYTGMQCEELAEKLREIFQFKEGSTSAVVLANGYGSQWMAEVISNLEVVGQAFKENAFVEEIWRANPVELLDADVDLQVVSEGAILAAGADGDGARAEVNRSNLAKIVDGVVVRDTNTGKILKPEGWTPPVLAPFACQSHPHFHPAGYADGLPG